VADEELSQQGEGVGFAAWPLGWRTHAFSDASGVRWRGGCVELVVVEEVVGMWICGVREWRGVVGAGFWFLLP